MHVAGVGREPRLGDVRIVPPEQFAVISVGFDMQGAVDWPDLADGVEQTVAIEVAEGVTGVLPAAA